MKEQVCIICGQKFIPKYYNKRKTCSKECHHKLSGISETGRTHSEESKRKISISLIGNKYALGKHMGKDNPMFGKPRTEEVKRKIREKLVGKTLSKEVREEMSIKSKNSWKDPNSKQHTRVSYSHELHDSIVNEKFVELEKEGYLCIQLNKKPIPDIIAMKDGKIYAVEVEGRWSNIRKVEFYENSGANKFYDSLIWINFFRSNGKTETRIKPFKTG